jgi:flagellar FliL protein
MAKTAKKDEAKKPEKEPEADASAAAEGAEGEQPKKKMSGKKLVLFVILPALLGVGGLGGAAWFFFLRGGSHAAEAHADAHADPHAAPTPAAVFMNLPEMIVNLDSGGRRANFLKINIALEVASATDVPRIEAVMPRIVDNFQVYLRALRVEDLRGSAGMFRLREELLARVNTAAQPARINDVLFREMLVQ